MEFSQLGVVLSGLQVAQQVLCYVTRLGARKISSATLSEGLQREPKT